MKLLIADDEDYTRQGLLETICWEDYGIDEIMQAVNGVEAARIARWFLPDIILTDVRMPKMDGIGFAEKILEWNPECRIIFMSGYMEIEYLKSAIRLSAIDYIEKPIDLELLQKALKKAAEEIERLQKSRQESLMSRELLEQKLFHFLISRDASQTALERLARETQFSLTQSYVCVMIQMTKKEPEKAFEELNRFFGRAFCRAVGIYNEGKRQFEFILAYPEAESYRLTPMYQRFLGEFPQAKLGVGVEATGWRNIYNSYRTAGAAINCAFYQETERLFQIDEGILQKSIIDPGIYGEFVQLLSERPGELDEWFDRLFTYLYGCRYYQKEHVYTLMISLLTAVYGRYPQLYGDSSRIRKEEEIPDCVRKMETLGEIQRFAGELLAQLKSRQEVQNGYSRVIRGVVDYVAAHYREEALSVTDIAQYLHLSSAYLNVLFKQEMKVTLKQYLSNYRLERAKRMLEQGYDKITEIAECCGYANANYFAKVFRENVGMSPAEYRRKKEQMQ